MPRLKRPGKAYTARLVYEDAEANAIGNASHRFSTLAGFNAGVTALLDAAAVSTAHGGSRTSTMRRMIHSRQPSGATMQMANSTW